MPPTLSFARVVPVQHLNSTVNSITDTTENTPIHFRIESDGFATRTWWPRLLPGNPAWLPFVKPIWYSWSYTDKKGYLRNLFDMPSLARQNVYQRAMPVVAPGNLVESFRIHANASDRYGNSASALRSVTVHRPVEVDRRAERDRNAPSPSAIIEAVSGVYPGPAKVTYTETHARSCQRTYTETQSASVSVPLAAINLGFGFDVTTAVSSTDEHAISRNVEFSILAGQVGIWYRRAQPYARHADVLRVDELGNRNKIHEMVVLDHLFSIYLGQGVDEASARADAQKRLA